MGENRYKKSGHISVECLRFFGKIGARMAVLFSLNCIYACTVTRYVARIFKIKYALETSVTSHTACLQTSSVSSSRFHWRKRDLPAVQHIQLRAHTVTQTRTAHHSGSWFATRKYFCKDESKAAPPHAMEVQIHPFFSSHLNRSNWLALCTSRFNPAEPPIPFW